MQPTAFLPTRKADPDKRVEFQSLYQELIDDERRSRRICEEVIESVRGGRSPLVLTERNDHLERLEEGLAPSIPHLVALRGGMGKKQRQAIADRLAAIPPEEGRVILATGMYVGEGFDDPRLDTLFLTLPVSWRGTIARVAVELDGPQHLADPVAYRRDRRKDQLLQQNGYLVLRFLVDDVSKELDSVLDGILRTLCCR